MRRRWIVAGAMALILSGCGDDGGDGTGDAGPDPDVFVPDLVCPGSAGCEEVAGEGTLRVGAARAEVTGMDEAGNMVPSGQPAEILSVDVNGDGYYDPGAGDEFEDLNGNGEFDAVWLAGYGNPGAAHAATGVVTPMYSVAVALEYENVRVAIVSIDCVGLFIDDMDRIREAVSDLDIDHVLVSSTHVHSGRDTIGLWGIDEFTTAIAPAYQQYVIDQSAQAIRDAVADLRDATVQYSSFRLRDLEMAPVGSPQGMRRFVGDSRDPNIIDDEVRVMRFAQPADDATIATVVNWSAHPEYAGGNNSLLSGDFPHWLREGVSNGVQGPDGEVPGVGGTTLYLSGGLGGQIGPNDIDVIWWDGTEVPEKDGYTATPEMDAPGVVGRQLAYFVLDSLADGGGSVTDMTAALGLRTKRFFVPMQNSAFQLLAVNFDVLTRELYEFDRNLAITPDNTPHVLSEVTVLDIGRASLISTPGELHPELFVGGYDGSNTPAGEPLVKPDNPNPPDLAAAPEPPHIRDLARSDAEYVWLVGLGNDYLGYLVPEYNYVLAESAPYLEEAPGDHYEETVSIGRDGWPTILDHTEQLLRWTPDDASNP